MVDNECIETNKAILVLTHRYSHPQKNNYKVTYQKLNNGYLKR